jgi:hypothetical protein
VRAFAPSSAVLLTAVALAACATSPGASPRTETVRVIGAGGAMTAEIHPSDNLIGGDVPVPIDRAWTAVRVVYDSLRLSVARLDPATHTIESSTLRVRRRLGDVPLSRYLHCGTAQGGQSADSYEVQLTVRTVLKPNEPATTVSTSVSAEGRPITLSGDYSPCTSTGNLEKRIVALVAQLGR